MPTMTRVSSGSAALNPAKSVWKRGMKNTIKKMTTPTASVISTSGYIMAALTLARSSFSCAWKSAIWPSTTSRNPPASPASTIAV